MENMIDKVTLKRYKLTLINIMGLAKQEVIETVRKMVADGVKIDEREVCILEEKHNIK